MGIHIVKRANCPLWKKALFYLIAIGAALLIGSIILFDKGVNPIAYYTEIFTLTTINNPIPHTLMFNYLRDLVPLVLTAVGLSLAFKMRFWNIGGEGQFIMGAIGASIVAIKLGSTLPSALVLILMCLVAMIMAGLYGLIVAFLKVKYDTNETLLTLMLNYIALYFLTFLLQTKGSWNFFLDPGSNRPKPIVHSENTIFPTISLGGGFELNTCVIFTFVICVFVYIYLKRTKQGYEINVVGDSTGTAKYAGMKVNKIVLRTIFLSACLIGLAAAFKIGTKGVGALSTTITNDVGWTAIIVAWLAQLNTWAIVAVSALLNLLHYGSTLAPVRFPGATIDGTFADILQGIILFLVLAADFMIRFRFVRTKKEEKNG